MKPREKILMIGSEIKAILDEEGFSGYRISKETGIDETYISKIIHNRINPSYLTLKRILDVLGYRICFEKVAQRKEGKPEFKVSQKKPRKRR
jgi:transcriptional regulator with XRE-family HTH domain